MPEDKTVQVPGISSEDFANIQHQIDIVKDNRANESNMIGALQAINAIICRTYGLEKITVAMLNSDTNIDFFGLNVYPSKDLCKNVVATIINTNGPGFEDAKTLWSNSKVWHIDYDSKLFYNPSVVFNSAEIAAIILYEVERIMFSYQVLHIIYRAIKINLLNMNYVDRKIAKSQLCQNLMALPFLQTVELKDFKSSDKLDENSILKQSTMVHDQYLSALTRIVTGYGNSTIDRDPSEISYKVAHVLTWIYEGIHDLKYAMYLLKKNLREYLIAEQSIYVKSIMMEIYNRFANFQMSSMVREAALTNHPVTETMRDLEDEKQLNVFRKQYAKVKEEAEFSIFDKYGRVKKITQEEVDILRIEVSKIESADDKIYLLEKLYDKLDICNKSLDMLEDKDLRSKVKQSKEFLTKMKSQLMDIRALIFSTKATPKRYGLFIEYPPGYED